MSEYPLKDGTTLHTRYPLPEAAEMLRLLEHVFHILVAAQEGATTYEQGCTDALFLCDEFFDAVKGQ